MKYMLIAGEASGDLHASNLITSLKAHDPNAEFRFFGGDLMAKAARRSPEIHYEKMNVMGFSEVIRKLPSILRNLREAKRVVREFRPDVLILVDYPGFNLKVARYAHSLGIRVDWFISPKVWAWKEYRVKKIKKYVNRLYSILPFEEAFYAERGYKVRYVGNPSVQEIDYALGHLPPRRHFVERQGLTDPDKPIIALLPGSRRSEIKNNLPLMIAAAKQFPDHQYIVAAAPAVAERFYREVAQDPGLQVVFGATPTLLKYSKAAIVTSGTATLETALIGTPQVVCYRGNGSELTYKLMEKVLKVKYVSLPNLIVNNSIVPELLLHTCTPQAIVRELRPLLQNSPRREWQVAGYRNMRRQLGNSVASEYAAELIVDDFGDGEGREERNKTPGGECRKRPHRPRSSKRRSETAGVILLSIISLTTLISCGEKESNVDAVSRLQEVERLELARMTVGKVGVIKDAGFEESEGIAAKAQALFDGLKVGKRIGVYSYDTYLTAYVDLADLREDDVRLYPDSHTAMITLPPVQIMIDGREPEMHEEHLRVTGLRSRITPEERASLKARMASEVMQEMKTDKSVETALRSSAEAKARVWVRELLGNWGYDATVTFRD